MLITALLTAMYATHHLLPTNPPLLLFALILLLPPLMLLNATPLSVTVTQLHLLPSLAGGLRSYL
jgi:hypothetical protein